jgi:hypothetical protein
MKRLSTVRMKSVEDTTGNKQSREKSDVFYISLSGTTLNIMIFPVKGIFSQHFFFIFACCHPKYNVPPNRMSFADFNLQIKVMNIRRLRVCGFYTLTYIGF